jgi:hypothetical protein
MDGSFLIVAGFLFSVWGLLATSRLNRGGVLLTLLAPVGLLAIFAGILFLLVPGFFEAPYGF